MPRKIKPLPYRFSESASRLSVLLLFVLILSAQAFAQSTTDTLPPPCNDSNYQNCTALQGTSSTGLTGQVTYSFASDADLLAMFNNNQQAVDDFKSRARTAAQDWATRSGVSISEAQPGQAGNVTISASNSQTIRDAGAQVAIDPSNASRRTITFSDEYTTWSSEGRDSTFSHEWGHVLGMPDVAPDECPGVNTVMRQTSSNQQLVNGNSGAQPALNRPVRPNDCDVNKARTTNQPTITPSDGGGGGDGGSGGSTYYYYDSCTPYYWVYYESWDGGETWYETDSFYAGCW